MALTIEDGTGVEGADSFVTVAECIADAEAYFVHSLTGSTAEKEAALRRAWVFMSGLDWGADYPWPTLGGEIPEPVKLAQSVFARAEYNAPNYLSPEVVLRSNKVLNKVDAIGWDVQHGRNTVDAARPVVTMAMDLLKPYLAKSLGGVTFVERA